MSVTKKVDALNAPGKSFDEKLYMVLSAMNFTRNGYRVSELGEGMSVIEQVIWGWWKQRYLIDNKNCRAYEIMDGNMDFVNFTTDDIDWNSIKQLPEKAIMRAQEMSAQFPTFIRGFRNGIAEVSWQLNPDGRYYMDEDGFGMTSDEEITVYGFIDAEMNVSVKFQFINDDWKRLERMRAEAKIILKRKSSN
jgi:hypothetical protein